MNLENSVALVTGANRGLGKSLTTALLGAGAAKVYATARDTSTITDPRLTPLRLDITDPASVAAAAEAAPDVTLLINNAGISTGTRILDAEAGLRQELEANYLGPVSVARAFAPILATNGGGAVVNVLSVLSWLSAETTAGYSGAKAAMWQATNALRLALRQQGTLVTAVHVGYLDTDMAAKVTSPKISPDLVADAILRAVEAGDHELLVDDLSRTVRAALSGPLSALYPALA
jgi:NAD(P)-dependent dehydrogenase (short-subunit alcohol dehydrogenase family)